MRKVVIMLLVLGGLLGSHRPASSQSKALLLFGGEDHKTFLGCLNCTKTSNVSVCNKYGEFGSRYQSNSIWNPYGEFGSKYQEYSPWNKYSSSAPIIVDKDGGSYGYLSANKYHNDRTRIGSFVALLDFVSDEDDLEKARDVFCGE